LRHVRRVGQHDHLLHRFQLVADFLDDRQEGQIDEKQLVFGIVDDPGDLLGEEARVHRVIDASDSHQAIPDLQVPPVVPGKRRGPLAELEPVRIEPLGDAQRAGAQLAIVRAMDRPFHRAGDDFSTAMMLRRVIDQLVAKQRPILHQPAHRSLPCFSADLWPVGRALQARAS
jgi:hypothetical protein